MKISRAIKTIKYLHQDRRISRSILKELSFRPPFCWLVNKKPYNFIYQKRIASQTKNKPHFSSLIIETTNLCNAKCLMCPQPTMKRKKDIMKEKLFRKIISEAKDFKINQLILSGIGEPLLDPYLIARIKYARSQIKKSKIKIFTNASLLTPKKSRELIYSGLDDLVISFNGFENSYEKVMRLNFKQTVKNIKYFLQKRPKKLHVHLSCMYVTQNAKEINQLIKFWEDSVDSLAVKVPENWAGEKTVKTPFILPYQSKKWPCKGLFDSFNIYWNGSVVLCCRDHEAQFIVGNVESHSMKEVWLNPGFQKIRQLHLNGQIDKIPICKNCDTPILNATSWW